MKDTRFTTIQAVQIKYEIKILGHYKGSASILLLSDNTTDTNFTVIELDCMRQVNGLDFFE